MKNNYKSVFDIIGPVMIGPSSSHTAGAVKIGRVANKLFGMVPPKVTVHYYGSFAQTHRGHGTDYAIAAGLLGFSPDDSRVPSAPMIARQRGIDLRFVEEEGESPIHHPNTAILQMTGDKTRVTVAGCSIGGGIIEIRAISLDGVDILPAGPLPIVIFRDYSKQMANALAVNTDLEEKAPLPGGKYYGQMIVIFMFTILRNRCSQRRLLILKRSTRLQFVFRRKSDVSKC